MQERGGNRKNGKNILLNRLTESHGVRKINGSYLLILKMLFFGVNRSGHKPDSDFGEICFTMTSNFSHFILLFLVTE